MGEPWKVFGLTVNSTPMANQWGCMIGWWDTFGWSLRSIVHSAPFTRLVWYTYLREEDLSVRGGKGRFTGLSVSPFVLRPCPGPWW